MHRSDTERELEGARKPGRNARGMILARDETRVGRDERPFVTPASATQVKSLPIIIPASDNMTGMKQSMRTESRWQSIKATEART